MDISKVFEKPLFWITVISILFLVPLVNSLQRPQVKVPPVLGQIPNFELTNQNNTQITWENSYRGSVLVVNFIFTSCPDVCPLLTQQMAKIQNRILSAGATIKLLSISVDPENDRPHVLKDYGEKFGARFAIWSFLTGDLMQIYDVVVKGFKVALDGQAFAAGDSKSRDDINYDLMGITHGENFVIVDQLGQIRSYERARNDSEINEIVRMVGILANQNPAYAPRPESLDFNEKAR